MSPKKKDVGGRPRITRSPLKTTCLELEESELARVDRLVALATKENPDVRISRSLVVRELLKSALDHAEGVRARAKKARAAHGSPR